MKLHLIFPSKWQTLDTRIKALETYLSNRYKNIYGTVSISYTIQTLPSLTLNTQGVHNKKDILDITKLFHNDNDAVGIVFPVVKGEKYFGNYYPNDGSEYKMDFYVKSDEKNKHISEQLEDMIEHEMAHAISLDLGLTGQGTDLGFKEGADNTHYFFYNNKKEEFYTYINEKWKAKSSILSQMLEASRKLLLGIMDKKKVTKPKPEPKPETKTEVEPTGMLPEVKEKMEKMIQICDLLGMPIRVTSGFRTVDEQYKLFKQGRLTPGPVVTNAVGMQSKHVQGKAFDIVFRKGGYNVPDSQWELVGQIGEQLGLEWGGRWKKFIDKPHFEI